MTKHKCSPGVANTRAIRAPRPIRRAGSNKFYIAILLATFTNIIHALPHGNVSAPAAREIASCRAIPETPNIASNQQPDDKTEVKIHADEIEFPKRNVAHLRGYVELVRGGHHVYADELIYNRAETRAVAKGAVKFQSAKGDMMFTSILKYYVATGKVVSGNASFIIVSRKKNHSDSSNKVVDSYGTASRVTLVAKNVMYLENANITSCQDGKEHTVFTAHDLRVDLNDGIRTARRVKIRITLPDRHDRIREMAK